MKKLLSSCSFMGLLFILVLAACSKKHFPTVSISQTIDSATVFTNRDTNIVSPAASTGLNIPFFNLLNLDLNRLSTPFNLGESVSNQAKVKASVLTDSVTNQKTLQIDCECDTLAIKATIKDKVQTVVKTTTVKETVVVREKFIPAIIKFFAWAGGLSILSLIILIIYHLKFKK